jgi:hypothetical protein
VTVEDNEDPVITCPLNIDNIAHQEGACSAVVTYETPSGTDNCAEQTTVQDVGLASGQAFPIGTTTNTFNVTDAAGNSGML